MIDKKTDGVGKQDIALKCILSVQKNGYWQMEKKIIIHNQAISSYWFFGPPRSQWAIESTAQTVTELPQC